MCIQIYALISCTFQIITRTILFALLAVEDLIRSVVQALHGYVSLLLQFFYICPAYCISCCCGWCRTSRNCTDRYYYSTASLCFDLSIFVFVILLLIFFYTYWIEDFLTLLGFKVNMAIFKKDERSNVPRLYADIDEKQQVEKSDKLTNPLHRDGRSLEESIPLLAVDEFPTDNPNQALMTKKQESLPILPVLSNFSNDTKQAEFNNDVNKHIVKKLDLGNTDDTSENLETMSYFAANLSAEVNDSNVKQNIEDVTMLQNKINNSSSIANINYVSNQFNTTKRTQIENNTDNIKSHLQKNSTSKTEYMEIGSSFSESNKSQHRSYNDTKVLGMDYTISPTDTDLNELPSTKDNKQSNNISKLISKVNEAAISNLGNILISGYVEVDEDDNVINLNEIERNEALLEENHFNRHLLSILKISTKI